MTATSPRRHIRGLYPTRKRYRSFIYTTSQRVSQRHISQRLPVESPTFISLSAVRHLFVARPFHSAAVNCHSSSLCLASRNAEPDSLSSASATYALMSAITFHKFSSWVAPARLNSLYGTSHSLRSTSSFLTPRKSFLSSTHIRSIWLVVTLRTMRLLKKWYCTKRFLWTTTKCS